MGLNVANSLHVSLPLALRQFVDKKTNGQYDFSTPSEYVRSLIRKDMEREAQKKQIYQQILQSAKEADQKEFATKAELLSLLKEFE